jgi:Uncharacterized stress protein (general stress protein 26)
MRDAEKTVGNIIDKQKICYITSIDSDGFPNTKAMLQPRKRNGIREIFFSTNTSSLKVKSFRNNAKACVYFCDSRFFRGVMLKGTVEVIEDQSLKDMLWQDGDTMYYSNGKTDPDYCVLKLMVISGRYYSNFKSEDFRV